MEERREPPGKNQVLFSVFQFGKKLEQDRRGEIWRQGKVPGKDHHGVPVEGGKIAGNIDARRAGRNRDWWLRIDHRGEAGDARVRVRQPAGDGDPAKTQAPDIARFLQRAHEWYIGVRVQRLGDKGCDQIVGLIFPCPFRRAHPAAQQGRDEPAQRCIGAGSGRRNPLARCGCDGLAAKFPPAAGLIAGFQPQYGGSRLRCKKEGKARPRNVGLARNRLLELRVGQPGQSEDDPLVEPRADIGDHLAGRRLDPAGDP